MLLSKLGLPHLRVEVLAAADDRDDVISLELVLQALLDLPQELDPVLHELEDDVLVRRRRVLVLREEVLTTDDLYGSMGGRKREGRRGGDADGMPVADTALWQWYSTKVGSGMYVPYRRVELGGCEVLT